MRSRKFQTVSLAASRRFNEPWSFGINQLASGLLFRGDRSLVNMMMLLREEPRCVKIHGHGNNNGLTDSLTSVYGPSLLIGD